MHNLWSTIYTIFVLTSLHNTPKMTNKRTEIQCKLAIYSFASGVLLASVCLFAVKPYGEISNSAISIVSELLVLCGALLGIKTSYDVKMDKFESELNKKQDK